MTITPTEAFLSTITTESEALDAISDIKARFNLTGTLFTPTDVSDMVYSAMPAFVTDSAFQEALCAGVVDNVTREYEYRKLGDILSERGNDTLAGAVDSVLGLLEDGAGYTFTVRLLVYRDPQPPLFPAIVRAGFPTATEALQWAQARMGTMVKHPTHSAETLAFSEAVGQCVEGFSLAVMRGDTQMGLISGTVS